MKRPVVTIKRKTVGKVGHEREVSQIFIDDIKLNCVSDYSIKKSSATDSTELFIRFDCGELHEVWEN